MTSERTKAHIVCEYTLLRSEHPSSECDGIRTFRKLQATGRTVEIALSYEEKTVLARQDDVELDPEVVDELSRLNRHGGSEMSAKCAQAIGEPLTEIRTSVQHLLTLIKYHLRHFDLRESLFSVKSERWGVESENLRDIPTTISVSVNSFSIQPLNGLSHNAIQNSLSGDIYPLLAMRHLHRAKHESMPHHKWIDATIAAELAVKEVLCTARPEIAPVLLEVPSPPFSKMYGSLLKTYLGAESPYRKKLIKGQEKRNALIHRHDSQRVDQRCADDYVNVVEAAIFHLLSLLYPNDELVKQACHRTDS